MKTLSSNADLYEYLVALEIQLREHRLTELGDSVSSALGNASSLATEFLGEARIALRLVADRGRGALSGEGGAELDDVLKQLDVALDGRR